MTGPVGAHVIFVAGVSASGKSTLGRALSRELGWALLDLDTMTGPFFEALGGEAEMLVSSAETGRTAINAIRYECLFATAAENLSLGISVVMVAPFTAERNDETAWRERLEGLGVERRSATLVWVDAPRRVVLERMRQRGAERDLARLEAGLDPAPVETFAVPAVDHVRIDGTAANGEQIAEIRKALAVEK